jgi:hypothetical protein
MGSGNSAGSSNFRHDLPLLDALSIRDQDAAEVDERAAQTMAVIHDQRSPGKIHVRVD